MVSLDVVVSFSSSSGSETVSSLLSVPNDDSGMFSVMPIALFISEAVRATGSLLLSFAGGDTSQYFETHVAFVVGSRAVDRAQWDLSRGRTIPAREVTLDPELARESTQRCVICNSSLLRCSWCSAAQKYWPCRHYFHC